MKSLYHLTEKQADVLHVMLHSRANTIKLGRLFPVMILSNSKVGAFIPNIWVEIVGRYLTRYPADT